MSETCPMTPQTPPGRTVVPDVGQAVVIRFDDANTVVWWGRDGQEREVVAALEGRLLTWQSVEDAVAHASEAGWGVDHDAGLSSDENTLMDFSGAQARLANQNHPVQPHSAMELWNFATDVAHTLGIAFNDTGSMPDACHEKLTKATIPAAFGLDTYTLVWTPAELKVVRRVMADAVRVVRLGLGTAT